MDRFGMIQGKVKGNHEHPSYISPLCEFWVASNGDDAEVVMEAIADGHI